jgi:hypothetical protein
VRKNASAMSVFMVKVMGVFYYFDGLPDDARMVGLDIGYDLCSVEVGALFCL